jgi:hypothetical protein
MATRAKTKGTCETGTCDHPQKFPHYIKTTPAETVMIRDGLSRVKITRPKQDFIICLKCRHWTDSGTGLTCDCCVHGHRGQQA